METYWLHPEDELLLPPTTAAQLLLSIGRVCVLLETRRKESRSSQPAERAPSVLRCRCSDLCNLLVLL